MRHILGHTLAAFLALTCASCAAARVQQGEWTGWRGPDRNGISVDVPKTLPSKPRILWKRPLTGPGLSGVVVAANRVIVADKDADDKNDIFRCLDADSGKELWALSYPASGDMDYTNSSRATPVIYHELVYLLSAFGDLHCVKLTNGEVVWKRNIVQDLGAKLPHWGMCASPLLVDGKFIVSPGARDASLAALNPQTGKLLWKTPGRAPAYASLIVGTLGGVKQIVGYDEVSLGGWDPATGKRLWELVPEIDGDFNLNHKWSYSNRRPGEHDL